ncbi:MAG: hypothetical protein EXQ59_03405 [Acidobacteria bacterium]|nr:hypothetical protein [Acidobacteriota bacterium]
MRRFQPNRIEFDVVNGDEPARAYLNTNWSPGWHTNAGTITVVDDGPSFVTLAPGQSGTFAFWFVPKGLWIGVLVLTAAILVSISVWHVRIGLAYARPGASNERPTFAEVVAGRAVGAMHWLRLRRDWLYLLSLGYGVAVIQRLDWRPEDSDETIFLALYCYRSRRSPLPVWCD